MMDMNQKGFSLEESYIIWNRVYNYKYIKVKYTAKKRGSLIGKVESNDLIKFEIIMNGVT
jgi:hypothetical protein